MQIIAAYPCLGKTTIYQLNKDKCFDREFCESRSTLGMTPEQQDRFFDNCAEIVRTQYEADYHKVLFITEDERLLSRLEDLKKDIILVFPAISDRDSSLIQGYIEHVIERSGKEWFERVIKPELPTLQDRIRTYKENGWDVRLTHPIIFPYLEYVVELPEDFVLPNETRPFFLKNIKLVAFDFDDTLAKHVDTFYVEHRGDGDEYFMQAHQSPDTFYDDIEVCSSSPSLKNIVGYCRLNNIPMYCISKMRFSLHMEAKKQFVKKHYGDDIEFVMASSQEMKNDILRILCKEHNIEPSEVLFIDDLKENVDRAHDAGYKVIFPAKADAIMVSRNISLLEYMDNAAYEVWNK